MGRRVAEIDHDKRRKRRRIEFWGLPPGRGLGWGLIVVAAVAVVALVEQLLK